MHVLKRPPWGLIISLSDMRRPCRLLCSIDAACVEAVCTRGLTALERRYHSRGLFLQPPTVGLVDGVWTVTLPPLLLEAAGREVQLQLTFPSQDAIFDMGRDSSALVQLYRGHVQAAMDRCTPVRSSFPCLRRACRAKRCMA